MGQDWDASTYDRVSNPHVRWAGPVIERIDPAGLKQLLDAGCGSGRVTQMVLERFPDVRVIGLDASDTMLAEATKKLERFSDRIEFVQADLSRPLPELPRVDAVFSTAAFHWITDHRSLFRNLANVLRPGGQFVAQWGGGDNIARLVDVLTKVGDGWTGPWYFANAEQTEHDLLDAGFTDTEVWTNDDPADFETQDSLEEYLRTVCLGPHLERLAPDEREQFVRVVAERLPDRRIDYVRLNATARLS